MDIYGYEHYGILAPQYFPIPLRLLGQSWLKPFLSLLQSKDEEAL